MVGIVKKFGWRNIDDLAYKALERICELDKRTGIALYPVPRGGIFAAQAIAGVCNRPDLRIFLTEDPNQADFIIDDIIDSGATKRAYEVQFPGKPFIALVEKERIDWWYEFPWERMNGEVNGPEENIRRLIEFIGDDPNRDGLKDTPARVIRSYSELFSGYKTDPKEVFKTFEHNYDEMVVLTDVEFYSTCEHHLLPFFGQAHIAYIPEFSVGLVGSPKAYTKSGDLSKVIGISKLARLLEIYSRRLTIQERICQEVTAQLDNELHPLGSACILEATHLCMACRGVNKQHSRMITSSLTGKFRDAAVRQELFSLIGK